MSQPYLIADTASAEAPLTRQVSFGAELESSSSEIGEKDSAAVQSQPRTDTALMAHGSVIVGIDDDEGVNTHGGGVLSRRDSLGGAKAASDSNEDDTGDEDDDTRSNSTRTSGSDYSNNAGLSVVRCGDCKLKIPFTVWTFVAMLIPIALVVTVTSINVSASQQELDTIHTYAALVTRLNDCVAALAAERGSSGPWLTRGAAADRTALDTARGAANSACLASYADELRDRAAASGRFLPDYSLFQQTNVPLLAVWRTQVDARTAVGKAARAFYTDFIDNSSRVVTPIANSLQQSARLFSEIKMLITCYNYIGLGRGVGNALAAPAPGTATTAALATLAEYQAAYAQSLLARTTVSGLASQRLSDRFAAWEALNTTQLMWSYLAVMASNATVIQAQYSSQWWPVISAGLGGLADVQAAHLSYVASGDIAQATSDFNTAFLVSGVAACLLAAGLLAFQQSRVRGELEGQVVKMRKTKRAVSAFVPRFFLRQMGYTAITQVRSGECTKVALAMLFADIRHFTTVAEGMSCEDLFDWVQGYFKRMTSIVDCNRGNVNQFIGDALFAVFSTAADSVRCAVAMQSDVQQLNIQRLCESNTAGASSPRSYVPVEIGVEIHHDVVALGILGDESRHTCTTIASSVNLASRLEGLTKQLGCRIIASDAVVSQLTSLQRETFRSRRLGAVVVKGSEAAVNVVDIFQSDSRELQQYKSATKEAFEALMLICSEHGGDFSLGTFHEDVSGTPSPASLSPAALVTLPNAIDDTSVAVPAVGTAFQLAPLTRMLSVTHDATPPHVEASSAPPDLETPLLRLRFAELRQTLFQAEERYAVTDRALHEMLSRMLSRKRRIGISFHDK